MSGPTPDEPAGRHERTVLAMFRALESGDVDGAAAFWVADCRDHAAVAGSPPGRAGVRATLVFVLAAFPTAAWRVTRLVSDEHSVACQVVVDGTHDGDIYGVPATGRPVRWRHFHFFDFDGEGQIVEHDAVRDDRGLLRQLGVELPAAPRSADPVQEGS